MRRVRPGSIVSGVSGGPCRDGWLVSGTLVAAALAIAVSGGGCFSDRGVAIEIDLGDTSVGSVELFIGKTPCDPGDNPAGIDCRSITPPAAGAPLHGDIWFRDDIAPSTAVVKDRKATFQLRSDDAVTIPLIIAVGIGEGDRGVAFAILRDVDIPIHSARVLKATLMMETQTDRVQVWRKTMPPSSCVMLEHRDGSTATHAFVVPAEDPDCDDVVNECNAAAWHGAAPAGSAAQPDCLTKSSGSACLLGSHACTDGGPLLGGECAPQHDTVCAPGLFCNCTNLNDECLDTVVRSSIGLMPHIECTFPADGGLNLCKDKESATIQLSHFPSSQTCEQPLIASLALAEFSTSATFSGVTMELTSAQQPCSFSIIWKQGLRTDLIDSKDFGAIEVPTSIGAVVFPISLQFTTVQVGTCGAAPAASCTFTELPADTLWSCVQ